MYKQTLNVLIADQNGSFRKSAEDTKEWWEETWEYFPAVIQPYGTQSALTHFQRNLVKSNAEVVLSVLGVPRIQEVTE